MMTPFRKIFPAIAVALAAAAAGAAPLGDADLAKVIPGFHGQGSGFTVDYAPDGTVLIKEAGTSYSGTWRIKGNAVCNKIRDLAGGKETCRSVTMQDARHYVFTRTDNGKSYVLELK